MLISPHFTYSELTHTNCKYPNMPTPEQLSNLKSVCLFILEPIRNILNIPILVNSAFRSPEVNRTVGGVPNSMHLQGLAVDINTSTMSVKQVNLIQLYCSSHTFIKECIVHSNYVHIAL